MGAFEKIKTIADTGTVFIKREQDNNVIIADRFGTFDGNHSRVSIFHCGVHGITIDEAKANVHHVNSQCEKQNEDGNSGKNCIIFLFGHNKLFVLMHF